MEKNRFDSFTPTDACGAYFPYSREMEVECMTEFTTRGFEKDQYKCKEKWQSHILVLFLFSSPPPSVYLPSLFHNQHEQRMHCEISMKKMNRVTV